MLYLLLCSTVPSLTVSGMSRTVITILGAHAERAVEEAASGVMDAVSEFFRVRSGVAAVRQLSAANWPVLVVDPDLLSTSEAVSVCAACRNSGAALIVTPSLGAVASERSSILLRGGRAGEDSGGQLLPEVVHAKPVIQALIRKLPDRLVSNVICRGLSTQIEVLANGAKDAALAAIAAPWIPHSRLFSRPSVSSRRTVSRALASAGLASLGRLRRVGSLALAWDLLAPREGLTRANVARLSGLGSVRTLNSAFDEFIGGLPVRLRQEMPEIEVARQLLSSCTEPVPRGPAESPR